MNQQILQQKLKALTCYCEEKANDFSDKSPAQRAKAEAYAHIWFGLQECLRMTTEPIVVNNHVEANKHMFFYIIVPIGAFIAGLYFCLIN